jgi:membrane protein YdbS with pleckstrin-like domain
LIELRIHTAATTHHIAGLDIEEAQELRNQIIALVKVAKEDV